MTTPYAVSNIQPHTIVAVRAGIAHASSSPTETSTRKPLLSAHHEQGDEGAEHHREDDIHRDEGETSEQYVPELLVGQHFRM